MGRQHRWPRGYITPYHLATAHKPRTGYFQDQLNTCYKLATNPKLQAITNAVVQRKIIRPKLDFELTSVQTYHLRED